MVLEAAMADGAGVVGSTLRVVNVYATPWRLGEFWHKHQEPPLGDLIYRGAMDEEIYRAYRVQLPQRVPDSLLGFDPILGDQTVSISGVPDGVTVASGSDGPAPKAELFALPSNQIVLAVTITFVGVDLHIADSGDSPLDAILERSIDGDNVTIGGLRLEDALTAAFHTWPGEDKPGGNQAILPERHQLVFASRVDRLPSAAFVDMILYRKQPRYWPQFVEPKWPSQLNPTPTDDPNDPTPPEYRRRTNTNILGVLTPYVSLIYGHEPEAQDSILISTVHAVGTAARFRTIWREAYLEVLAYRRRDWSQAIGKQTRAGLETLSDRLGDLESDLTFSVEFPLLQVVTFRNDLYVALDLEKQAKTLSQMFDQLAGSVKSELTAIEQREAKARDRRHAWNAFAAGLLSFVGVTIAFVVTYLAILTSDINQHVSMWNVQYFPLYVAASALALVPAYFILVPFLAQWTRYSVSKDARSVRGLIAGIATTAVGTGLAIWALHNWPQTFASTQAPDTLVEVTPRSSLVRTVLAFGNAFGWVVVLVGITLIVLWWRGLVMERRHRAAVEESAQWREKLGAGESGGDQTTIY
jgi:hypothetical protein